MKSVPKNTSRACGPPYCLIWHLAGKYAPLSPEGNGLQSVYLTEIEPGLAAALFSLIGAEIHRVADVGQEVRRVERDSPAPERDIEEWERRVEAAIDSDAAIPPTERTALVQARRGRGLFRDNVRSMEGACRITWVERMEHLVASRMQRWRDSSNGQRLAQTYGGIDRDARVNVGALSEGQRQYLEFHRENVPRVRFRRSRGGRS